MVTPRTIKQEEERKEEDREERDRRELEKLERWINADPSYQQRQRRYSKVVREGLKDLSLSTNAIREERKRKIAEMRSQVMQTLTDATFLKLGGQDKAVLDMNKGLIHILELINKAPEGKMSTRELLRTINSTAMHKLLKEAELYGFVKRELEQMPQGQRGGRMMVNSLTEEGRVLLVLAKEFSKQEERRH
jgi:hypothetical protein